MDDRLLAITVLVFLLDYGLLGRFALLDDSPVAIPIPIMGFANTYSGSHGTSPNAYFVGQRGRGYDGNDRSSK